MSITIISRDEGRKPMPGKYPDISAIQRLGFSVIQSKTTDDVIDDNSSKEAKKHKSGFNKRGKCTAAKAVNECDTPTFELLVIADAVKEIDSLISFGERTEENVVEQGGVLFGKLWFDENENIVFGEAHHAILAEGKGEAEELLISADAWLEACAGKVADKYAEEDIYPIGWFHTHPNNLSAFFSGKDHTVQSTHFNSKYSFAIVFNPHRCREMKAFCGVDGVPCNATVIMPNALAEKWTNLPVKKLTAVKKERVNFGNTTLFMEKTSAENYSSEASRIRSMIDSYLSSPRRLFTLLFLSITNDEGVFIPIDQVAINKNLDWYFSLINTNEIIRKIKSLSRHYAMDMFGSVLQIRFRYSGNVDEIMSLYRVINSSGLSHAVSQLGMNIELIAVGASSDTSYIVCR